MEYNPRYPQPFTLTQAIALDPAIAWDEIARLRNSLLHLRRSQNELQEYLRELAPDEVDLEASQAAKENETTMHVLLSLACLPELRALRASQDERIFMLKLALAHHGHTTTSDQMAEPLMSSPSASGTERPRNTTGTNANGLDDFTDRANPDSPQIEEQENGVYL